MTDRPDSGPGDRAGDDGPPGGTNDFATDNGATEDEPVIGRDDLLADGEPFAGFDVQVLTDRIVYAPGETVRITVTAANQGERWVEHHYPGWQRYELTIRDEHHRVVADDVIARHADRPAVDRWLPGHIAIWPTYWNQHAGPIVPARGSDPAGPRVPPGRYRAWVTWLGREPGIRARPAEVVSPWFELL